MFNFVEKRGFFYTCAIISLIIVASLFFNYKEGDMFLLCTNILTTIALLGLLFFSTKEHKELMKVFLTTLIICTIFSFIPKYYIDLIWIPKYVVGKNSTISLFDKIRFNFSLSLVSITFLCVCTIFINHCIMNYSNMPSKIAINLNKIIIFVILIVLITDKCSLFFSTLTVKLNPSLQSLLRFVDTTFLALTIVSAEAFINKKREERIAK